MKIQVLGCSGAIGGRARTTSFLIDQDILLDAGTGVGDLSLAQLARIDHVLLTHSHLDHLVSLPLLLDAVAVQRQQPLMLYAQSATLEIVHKHIFNGLVWPDFTRIPSPAQPFVRLQALEPGTVLDLSGRRFRSIAVNHSVPAVAFLLNGEHSSLVFSGDTCVTEELWRVVDQCGDCRTLIIETTFLDSDKALSLEAKHLCPSLLAQELAKLHSRPEIYITHLMPGQEQAIMDQIHARLPQWQIQPLAQGQVFEL